MYLTIEKINTIAKYAVGLIFLWLVIEKIGLHHPWRDELEALGILISSQSFSQYILNAAREGHGLLYYLLLYFLSFLVDNQYLLKAVNIGTIVILTVVLARAKNTNAIFLALVLFSHYLFWEYSIVGRSYILLFLLTVLYFQVKSLRVKLIILGLMVNAEVYGFLFAGPAILITAARFLRLVKTGRTSFLQGIRDPAFCVFVLLGIIASSTYVLSYSMVDADHVHNLANRFLFENRENNETLKVLVNLYEVILPVKNNILEHYVNKTDYYATNPMFKGGQNDLWMKGGYGFKSIDYIKALTVFLAVIMPVLVIFFYNLGKHGKKLILGHKSDYVLVLASITLNICFLIAFPEVQNFRNLGIFFILTVSFVASRFTNLSQTTRIFLLMLLLHTTVASSLNYPIYKRALSDSKSVTEFLKREIQTNQQHKDIIASPFYIAQNYAILGDLNVMVPECNLCVIGGVFGADRIIKKLDGNYVRAQKTNVLNVVMKKIKEEPEVGFFFVMSDLYRGDGDERRQQFNMLYTLATDENAKLAFYEKNTVDFSGWKFLERFQQGIIQDEQSVIFVYEPR